MKLFLNALAFAILASVCQAQNYKEQFDKHCQEGDTTKQLEILKKWEAENPQDAELFTSYFNYYFSKSEREVLTLMKEEPDGESLSLTDRTGKTAGYLASQIIIDPEILEKGLNKIDEGIKLYPNRLDMRFGKIYALGKVKDWNGFTDEIVATVQYSGKNNNQWTWTNNEKKKDGKEFFLSSLQDYQLTLYNTGNDDLLANMRTIAQEILKFYPNHVESLSNLSITYLLTGNYDKGIEALLKAEKINSKDGVVLSNIAHGYKMKGDKESAIRYYEKMLTLDDRQAINFARQQIEELKK